MNTVASLLISVLAAVLAGAGFHLRDKANVYLMGLFRDLARIKARRRRMGNNKAIFSRSELDMLLRKEGDPLKDLAIKINDSDAEDDGDSIIEYTEDELFEYGNGLDGKPILLSLFGRVYDVSSGDKFYGPNGKYKIFAGRDVTLALSTGCMSETCLGVKNSMEHKEYTVNEVAEGKRWIAFFETHDKYAYVGKLKYGGSLDEFLDNLLS